MHRDDRLSIKVAVDRRLVAAVVGQSGLNYGVDGLVYGSFQIRGGLAYFLDRCSWSQHNP
jgi:hypothetical protein